MKKACGAVSREELMQRLADPPKKFRPSTNMNQSGKMTALIRKALDDFLPSLSEIQHMMDKKISSQEAEKMLVTKDSTVIGESFAEVRNP